MAPPAGAEAALLKHLPPCLRELQRQEATGCQRARGEQDGHGFGDSHKRLEDADSQHGGQLAQGVQESKSCSSVEQHKQPFYREYIEYICLFTGIIAGL